MNKHLKAVVNVPVSLAKGLSVTLRNLVRTKTTKGYPEVMPTPMGHGLAPANPDDPFDRPYEIAPRFRGLHGLTRDPETGDHNCIGCMACAKVCPDDLISMDLEKREGHNGRYPVTFTVNIGPCCFCGLCAEVCPTPMRAIVMTDLFEWASYERDGLNLILTREDLERHGDYEVARRKAGRNWDADGNLIEVLPEEEGNPYFQFAPESGKADRMDKAKEKKADTPAAETKSEPSPPTAADPLAALAEAFAAAGLAPPDDVAGFDLASLDSIEDRKLRAQCKSAVMKARKATGEEAPPATAASPPAVAEPASDPLAALREAFAAAGLTVPDDLDVFDLSALDSIEDRKLRGQCKSALVKARRAAVGGRSEPAPSSGQEAAEPTATAPAEAADTPADSQPVEDEAAALWAALQELMAAAQMTVPESPDGLDLAAFDSVEDRKLRGQCKSTLRRWQRATGQAE